MTAHPKLPDDLTEEERRRVEALLAAPSYRLASQDMELLQSDDLRATRLTLELLKAELAQKEQRIRSTVVVFGGTRVIEEHAAQKKVERLDRARREHPDNAELQRDYDTAARVLAKARYYDVAREFGRLVSKECQAGDACEYVIVTGGGPGIMEAANRGAFDEGAKSIGLNIALPHEQFPNSYITPELCFQFRYFAIRKMHFLLRARALVVFPGGYGTMDELFEALTLVQTGTIEPLPIILCGNVFWKNAVNLEYLAAEGTIAHSDLDLVTYAETAEEIWEQIRAFDAAST